MILISLQLLAYPLRLFYIFFYRFQGAVSEEDVAPHQGDKQESNDVGHHLQRLTPSTQRRYLAPLLIGVSFARKSGENQPI